MNGGSDRGARTLEVARSVFALLQEQDVRAAVIGSVALAVHGYVRATRDLDLAVAVTGDGPVRLLARELRSRGHRVDLGEPAPDDPLGGVLTVSGSGFDPVQVVNLRAPDGRNARHRSRARLERLLRGTSRG